MTNWKRTELKWSNPTICNDCVYCGSWELNAPLSVDVYRCADQDTMIGVYGKADGTYVSVPISIINQNEIDASFTVERLLRDVWYAIDKLCFDI